MIALSMYMVRCDSGLHIIDNLMHNATFNAKRTVESGSVNS